MVGSIDSIFSVPYVGSHYSIIIRNRQDFGLVILRDNSVIDVQRRKTSQKYCDFSPLQSLYPGTHHEIQGVGKTGSGNGIGSGRCVGKTGIWEREIT